MYVFFSKRIDSPLIKKSPTPKSELGHQFEIEKHIFVYYQERKSSTFH